MPSAHNSGLCELKHCPTPSWTSAAFWNLSQPRCFFRRPKTLKSFVRVVQRMLETKLLQQGCHLSGCTGAWHQVTFIFSALWRSILVVTDSKMLRSPGCVTQCFSSQSPELCSRHTLTENTLWHIHKSTRRLSGKVVHCSDFWLEELFWTKKQIFTKYPHFPIKLLITLVLGSFRGGPRVTQHALLRPHKSQILDHKRSKGKSLVQTTGVSNYGAASVIVKMARRLQRTYSVPRCERPNTRTPDIWPHNCTIFQTIALISTFRAQTL
jgi:hypothetical protein